MLVWCQHVHFDHPNRDHRGMKKRKSLWCGIFFSLILSACSSNPIGDFGRIDASKASHLTQNSAKNIEVKNGTDFPNPLIFSKLEKKLRFNAHLLTTSNFNVSIADRPLIDGKADINGPISENALLNSFKASNYEGILEYNQAISIDLKKRIHSLNIFQKLASEVLNQNSNRHYIQNGNIDFKTKTAISIRQQENLLIVKNVTAQLTALHNAYRYVLNYGAVVEPSLSHTALSAQLYGFKSQINQLSYLN